VLSIRELWNIEGGKVEGKEGKGVELDEVVEEPSDIVGESDGREEGGVGNDGREEGGVGNDGKEGGGIGKEDNSF